MTIMAVILLYMGEQWITTGHGLHPMIAGSMAMFSLLLPYFAAYVFDDDDEDDEKDE